MKYLQSQILNDSLLRGVWEPQIFCLVGQLNVGTENSFMFGIPNNYLGKPSKQVGKLKSCEMKDKG